MDMIKFSKRLTRAQQAFTTAFLELLNQMDFDKVRTSEILSRSGYSRGAFYSNYQDKYDLAKSILDRALDAYVRFSIHYTKAVEEQAPDKEKIAIIRSYLQYVYDHRDLYNILLEHRIPLPSMDIICRQIRSALNPHVTTGYKMESPDFDEDFYDYLQLSGSFIHLEYWYLNNYQFSPDEMARKVYSILRKQTYTFRLTDAEV